MGSSAWTPSWLDDDPLEALIEQHGFALTGVTPPDADDLPGWTPSAEAAALLAGADLGVMSDGELVETVALWGRVVAWAQAQQMRAAAELDTRPAMRPRWSPKAGRVSRPHVTAEELAARLACTRHAAQSLVRSGRAFRGALAPTGDALAGGLIDAAKARVLVEALDDVALEVAVLVQEEVLPVAPSLTPRQLSEHVEAALLAVDPLDAEHRVARATAGRRVDRPKALPDGMAGIWAVLPAPAAVAMHAELDLVARDLRQAGDQRTLDQLRADVLVAATLARHLVPEDEQPSSQSEHLPTEAGRRPPVGEDRPLDGALLPPSTTEATRTGPEHHADRRAQELVRTARHLAGTPVRAHVQVTVPLDVLIGADEAPADLEGYGAIDAATARALARGGTWTRLVTDPLSGMVHDVGRTRYTPPADMARFVRARDRTCVVPGCSTPARACELDHTVPFGDPSAAEGGRTATDNLGALCKRDHLLKTHGGFGLVQDAPGVFTWITPTGQRLRRDPAPVGRPRGDRPSERARLVTLRSSAHRATGQDPPGRPDDVADRPGAPPPC